MPDVPHPQKQYGLERSQAQIQEEQNQAIRGLIRAGRELSQSVSHPADAGVLTATSETPIVHIDGISRLLRVSWLQDRTTQPNGTDFAVITLFRRSNGAELRVLGTISTKADAIAKWIGKDFPLDGRYVDMPANSTLSYEVTKKGAGVQLGAGKLVTRWREGGE